MNLARKQAGVCSANDLIHYLTADIAKGMPDWFR